MAFTIPNDDGTAQGGFQSEVDTVDIDILVAGISQQTGVIVGCACTPQGSPDMTVAVAVGIVVVDGTLALVSAGNVTIGAADGTNPRFDLIQVANDGTKSVKAGTAAASPKFPSPDAGRAVLAAVYIPASDTTISADQIRDKRIFVSKHHTYSVAADKIMISDAALTNDGEIKFPIQGVSGEVIFFEIFLRVNQVNATPDIKLDLSCPSGATAFWDRVADGTAWFGTGVLGLTESVGTGLISQAVGEFAFYFAGWVISGSTSGTVHLRWAQNTSSANNTTRRKGSIMRVRYP